MAFAIYAATVGPIIRTAIAVAVLTILLTVFGVLAVLIVKGHRWFTGLSKRAQMRAFKGVQVFQSPAPGTVRVVFHAYSGVLVFTTQVEHSFWATPDVARLVLRRLHRFNLTWGFFAYGAIVIPILSFANYWAQLNSVQRQAKNLADL